MPADSAGLEIGVKDAKMGQEGSRTAEVAFAGVRVGPEALVGGDGEVGYRAAMTSLARGRIHIAAPRRRAVPSAPSTSRSRTP